jgi:hypothetical protein
VAACAALASQVVEALAAVVAVATLAAVVVMEDDKLSCIRLSS